ncbi:hypothetical protein EDB86DRAFT_696253 [Lactarius hatsudake]|nr:hypothetical protein EDB86DRAFT_696253 [Lactarius hatsudake]
MWASSIFKMGRSVRHFRIDLSLNRSSRPHYLWHACVQPEYHLSNSAFGTIRYKSQCRFRQHRIVHAPTLIMGPDCCFRGSSCRCTLTSSSGVTMKFAYHQFFRVPLPSFRLTAPSDSTKAFQIYSRVTRRCLQPPPKSRGFISPTLELSMQLSLDFQREKDSRRRARKT